MFSRATCKKLGTSCSGPSFRGLGFLVNPQVPMPHFAYGHPSPQSSPKTPHTAALWGARRGGDSHGLWRRGRPCCHGRPAASFGSRAHGRTVRAIGSTAVGHAFSGGGICTQRHPGTVSGNAPCRSTLCSGTFCTGTPRGGSVSSTAARAGSSCRRTARG
jgi:hypothetical protein